MVLIRVRIHCCLEKLRTAQQLTQEELANRLGISRQSIIALERGRSLPSLGLAIAISKFFNQTLEEILGLDGRDDVLTVALPRTGDRKTKTTNIKIRPIDKKRGFVIINLDCGKLGKIKDNWKRRG